MHKSDARQTPSPPALAHRPLNWPAEARVIASVLFEAPEERSLPALLAPALRTTLIRLRRIDAAKGKLGLAIKTLAAFVGALKLKYGDVELAVYVAFNDAPIELLPK